MAARPLIETHTKRGTVALPVGLTQNVCVADCDQPVASKTNLGAELLSAAAIDAMPGKASCTLSTTSPASTAPLPFSSTKTIQPLFHKAPTPVQAVPLLDAQIVTLLVRLTASDLA
jgi:hypothetical protein